MGETMDTRDHGHAANDEHVTAGKLAREGVGGAAAGAAGAAIGAFARAASARSRAEATGSNVSGAVREAGHKTANALDDLKDRVDGNPASRPGPDATDRPERRE